jgi:hypothetical protein
LLGRKRSPPSPLLTQPLKDMYVYLLAHVYRLQPRIQTECKEKGKYWLYYIPISMVSGGRCLFILEHLLTAAALFLSLMSINVHPCEGRHKQGAFSNLSFAKNFPKNEFRKILQRIRLQTFFCISSYNFLLSRIILLLNK